LTATANNKSRLYGAVNPVFDVSYTGFKGTDTASVIDTLATASTTADALSGVNDYAITVTGAGFPVFAWSRAKTFFTQEQHHANRIQGHQA
jgi:hypothetical protein